MLSKWDGDLTLSIEDKHMDQTPWFNDFCPFLHTMKNGSCWKRPWHYQSAEETVMPALSGEYFTLLSSHSSETSWDVPLQWNCIMFCHCFIQTVTKPNSLYNSKRSLSTHLSSVPQLISLLETWSSFLWCSCCWFIAAFKPAVFCCRIHWIQTRNTGPIPHNLKSFC